MRRYHAALQLAPVLGDVLVQPAQVGLHLLEADGLTFGQRLSALRSDLHQHRLAGRADAVAALLELVQEFVGWRGHDLLLSGGAETVTPMTKAAVSAQRPVEAGGTPVPLAHPSRCPCRANDAVAPRRSMRSDAACADHGPVRLVSRPPPCEAN